ncbi:hypothetical protein NUM3379_22610 [Kineococcus sp. NUM-3379]
MSREEHRRLPDIIAALDAVDSHTSRGDVSDGLVFVPHASRGRCPHRHSIVASTVTHDLPQLRSAVERLLQHLDGH